MLHRKVFLEAILKSTAISNRVSIIRNYIVQFADIFIFFIRNQFFGWRENHRGKNFDGANRVLAWDRMRPTEAAFSAGGGSMLSFFIPLSFFASPRIYIFVNLFLFASSLFLFPPLSLFPFSSFPLSFLVVLSSRTRFLILRPSLHSSLVIHLS